MQILIEEETTEHHAIASLVHLMKLTHNRITRMMDGDLTPPNLSIQHSMFKSLSGPVIGVPQTAFTGMSTSKV